MLHCKKRKGAEGQTSAKETTREWRGARIKPGKISFTEAKRRESGQYFPKCSKLNKEREMSI